MDLAADAARQAARGAPQGLGGVIADAHTDLSVRQRRKFSLESRLRKAVSSGDFALAYQPIVALGARPWAVGAEALLRWPQSGGEPIGPDQFIPVAEELGLIHTLGLWVFEQACGMQRALAQNDRPLWMAINVSPLQFQQDTLARRLMDIAERVGVRPEAIKIEITESALIQNAHKVNEHFGTLTRFGFGLSLDDFGTGHSSLSRLIRIPFKTLKVDRSFVSDSPHGPGAAVVASLSGLAHTLGMEALGEGVETRQQQDFLTDHGYELAQGYLYARPMFVGAFIDWLHGQDEAAATGPTA